MRVIAGKAKGHRLLKVPGCSTRPITDRAKENLFNILGDWVVHTRWLDLFAGTGQVGIEALSRGAYQAVFLDLEARAIHTIIKNLEHTNLVEFAVVKRIDAFAYLKSKLGGLFDVIFVAPPQYKNYWSKTLKLLDSNPEQFLSFEGMAIVQIDPKEYYELELSNLDLFDKRAYGSTMFLFYQFGGTTES